MAVLGLALSPATSRATLTISLGNGSPNNTLQLVEPTGTTGTVFHAESGGQTLMKITTNTEGVVQGTGQAAGVATSTSFQTVVFTPDGIAIGWKGFEVNADLTADGSFTVTGIDQFNNPYSQTFAGDGSGQNRFFVLPDAVQFITKVTLDTTPVSIINKVEQFRIGDVVTGVNPIPEPSSLVGSTIGLVSLAAFAGLKKRRGRPEPLA
jgi:hypothetical protein